MIPRRHGVVLTQPTVKRVGIDELLMVLYQDVPPWNVQTFVSGTVAPDLGGP